MKAYQIQITKSSRDTFWYVNKIDQVFWAIKETNDGVVEYIIIPEGRNMPSSPGRWVNEDDCIVIKHAHVEVVSTTMVVEI
jgi:hypothetical protein